MCEVTKNHTDWTTGKRYAKGQVLKSAGRSWRGIATRAIMARSTHLGALTMVRSSNHSTAYTRFSSVSTTAYPALSYSLFAGFAECVEM